MTLIFLYGSHPLFTSPVVTEFKSHFRSSPRLTSGSKLQIRDKLSQSSPAVLGSLTPLASNVEWCSRSSPIKLTLFLAEVYHHCQPSYRYAPSNASFGKILTTPSEGVVHGGLDNIDGDYIFRVGDIISGNEGNLNRSCRLFSRRYRVEDLLGKGSFGQVLRCVETTTFTTVALKVIKNKSSYTKQAETEANILKMLQSSEDGIRKPFLHFEESFIFQGHMCIVTEMLGVDLYSHLREKRFSGLSLPIISTILSQILTACATLSDFGIIHADIKPENILASPSIPLVKLADFGSAFLVGGYSCSYIQSRYYRAPEAIVGTGYTPQIDVWSLGCVAAELFIGRPLFPGTSQFDQLFCICEMLGEVPQSMIERGWNRDKYFRQEPVSGSSKMRWRMMTPGEYRTANPPTPMHCPHSYILNSVAATIDLHATRLLSQNERSNRAKADRRPFIDFLQRLLVIDPLQRLTAKQALCHPFITQRPFTSSWQPPLDSADQAVVNGIVDPTNPFSGVIASIGYTLPPCTSKRSSLRLSSSSRLSSSPLSSPPSPTPSLSTPSSLFHARPARPPLSRHRTPTAYVSIPFVSNSSTSMSDDDLSSSNPKSRND